VKKKIGPLEAWQWGAIVLAIAVAYYFYKKHAAASSATLAATPAPTDTTGTPGTDTSSGPGSANPVSDPNLIDPSTGQPLLSEINQDITSLSSGLQNLATQEATDATAIENALGSLPSQLGPITSAQTGSVGLQPLVVQVTSPNGSEQGKTIGHASQKATAAEKRALAAQRRATAVAEAVSKAAESISIGSKRNPGHIVTSHPSGSNARTHDVGTRSHAKTVSPAQHQIAPPAPTHFTPRLPTAPHVVTPPHPQAPPKKPKPGHGVVHGVA